MVGKRRVYDTKCPDEILGGSPSYNSASATSTAGMRCSWGMLVQPLLYVKELAEHFVFNGHAPLSVSRGQTFPDNAFPDNFQWYFW